MTQLGTSITTETNRSLLPLWTSPSEGRPESARAGSGVLPGRHGCPEPISQFASHLDLGNVYSQPRAVGYSSIVSRVAAATRGSDSESPISCHRPIAEVVTNDVVVKIHIRLWHCSVLA